MSLILDGPHEIQVYVEQQSTDELGNKVTVPTDTPTPVRGRMNPVSSTELLIAGQGVATYYLFQGRDFPGGSIARVEWDGRTWDVQGEPALSDHSPATRHYEVLLKARKTKAVQTEGAP